MFGSLGRAWVIVPFGLGIYCQIAIAGVSIIVNKHNPNASDPDPPAEAVKCPSDMQAWNDWRASLKKVSNLPEFEDQMRFFNNCMTDKSQVNLKNDPEFTRCMGRISQLAQDILFTPNAPMDKEWTERSQDSLLPKEFTDPKLIDQMRDPSKRKEILNKIFADNPNYKNYKVYDFKSELPQVHGNHFLLMQYDVGDETRFINIDFGNLKYDDSPPQTFNGMIVPKDDSKKVQFFRYTIQDAVFDLDKNKRVSKVSSSGYLFSKDQKIQLSCSECHVTGFNPIKSNGVDPTPEIADLNKKWVHNRETYMSALQAVSSTPSIGPQGSQYRKKIIQACFPNEAPASQKKVAEAMSCTRCHSPDSRSNPLRSTDGPFLDIIAYFLKSADTMPPKSTDITSSTYLNAKERKALYDCLMTEYFGRMFPLPNGKPYNENGILLDYLLENKCPGENPI